MDAHNSDRKPDTLESLQLLLRREGLLLRLRDWLCTLDILWIVLLLFLAILGGGALASVSLAGAVVVIVLGVAVMLVSLWARRYRDAADTLTRWVDIRAVGPLAEALEHEDGQVYARIVRALTRLLPRLTDKDADLLNAEQRDCLHRALLNGDPNREARFLIAILRALAQVGDARSLPAIETLAASGADTRHEKRVRGAALRCLAALRKRRARERADSTPSRTVL